MKQTVYFPTCFILFGQCRSIKSQRDLPPDVDWEAVVNGADVGGADVADLTELLSHSVPLWGETVEGSPFTPHMGTVRLKRHMPSLWPPGVVELPIWIGRTVPGKAARERQKASRREKQVAWQAKKEVMNAALDDGDDDLQ